MEKIQHSINSLSLIFAGFFLVELVIALSLYAMQPFTDSVELTKLFGFLAMIPASIVLLQLCARYKSQALLWSAIGLFLLHYVIFVFI